ncbi:MAG TPA: hypothetical protein VJB35_01415 [Candidatus Nanoarchaeia archaeon]|nr:hypothetical protein [Candidatus Nanoarchaeia archaeon]
MFQEKEISVKLSKEADNIYQELNKIVGKEKLKGINKKINVLLIH